MSSFVLFFKRLCFYIILTTSIISPPSIYAQNTKRLNKQIHQIEKDIAYTRTLIKQTKKNKKTSLAQVNLLDKQIKKQSRLLTTLETEINNTNADIEKNKLNILLQNKEIDTLKQEYVRMISYARKNHNQLDRLMFIFAAKDFNQAYKRLKYFEQYSTYRKQQIKIITQKQDSLQATINKLASLKVSKQNLLDKKRKEQIQIAQEKQSMQAKLTSLKKREKELKAQLKQHNKRKQKLKKKIEAILAAEARKAKTTKATPAQTKLAKDFANNKGHLPWPVAKGVLYSSFGEHPHPVFKRVKTRNDGIDILTDKGQKARAVFKGEVRNIISVPGSSYFAVLLKHGDYFTLYSNLEEVSVSLGQQVQVKQTLGIVAQDPTDHTSKLQFQIWHRTQKLNPSKWLLRQK